MRETFTDLPILTDRFDRALHLASDHHRRQLRRGTEIPYVSHLLGVTALTLEMGASEDEAIAALLHDTVEDGGGEPMLVRIGEEFGPDVARIVRANSDVISPPKPPWLERKQAYVASIGDKLPDELHNMRTIVRDYRTHGDVVWTRFRAGEQGVRWYYRAMYDALSERRDDLGPAALPVLDELG